MKNNLKKDFFEKKQAKRTMVKLQILDKYIIPWMRKVVLSKYGSKSCSIIDTFAGAGVYSDGSSGSPIILLNEAIDFINQAREKNFEIRKIILTFIEKDEENYKQLKKNIENIVGEEIKDADVTNCKKYPQLYIAIENGTHEGFLKELTASVDNIIPTFFFMDPFGFSLPFEINKTILSKYSNSELLINLMYEELNRFITVKTVQKKVSELFGINDMTEIIEQIQISDKTQRQKIITETYKKQLKKAGAKYTLDFDIHCERGQLKMSMIYATNSLEGFDTMKDALDKISNTDKFEYFPESDEENEQISIEGFENKKSKSRELANYFYENANNREVRVSELIYKAKEHPYIPSNYTKKALTELNNINRIKNVYRKNGKKVKKNSFPDDAYVIII